MTADGKGGNVPLPEMENRKEREWFLGRVIEWEKMLRDSIGGALARSALMNELHLRRMEAEIAVAEPKSRGALYDQQATQTKEYRETVEKLQKMFPELAVAGKVSFKATISDLIRSYLDYYGSADRRLVDKVRTVMEMEYELRTSAQVESRYRFGLNLAIIDNINGLTDPNFMPRFKHRVLKVATAGFRAGVEAARAASREKVVDLENGVCRGKATTSRITTMRHARIAAAGLARKPRGVRNAAGKSTGRWLSRRPRPSRPHRLCRRHHPSRLHRRCRRHTSRRRRSIRSIPRRSMAIMCPSRTSFMAALARRTG